MTELIVPTEDKPLAVKGKNLGDCVLTASKRLKKQNPVTMLLEWDRDSVTTLNDAYTHNRRTTGTNVEQLRRNMDSNAWVENGVNFIIDWDGNPIDGKHTMLAFLQSRLEHLKIGVMMGCDPALAKTLDQGAKRTIHSRMAYVPEMRFLWDQLKGGDQERRASTALSYILFLYYNCRRSLLNPPLELPIQKDRKQPKGETKDNMTVVRDQIFRHPAGINLARDFGEVFMDVERFVERIANKYGEERGEGFFKSIQKADFYVPMMILFMAGRRRYEPMILNALLGNRGGVDIENPFYKLCNFINCMIRDDRNVSRRGDFNTIHHIYTFLIYMHAHMRKQPAPEILPVYGTLRDMERQEKALTQYFKEAAEAKGHPLSPAKLKAKVANRVRKRDKDRARHAKTARMWGMYTPTQKTAFRQLYCEAVRFFLDQIEE